MNSEVKSIKVLLRGNSAMELFAQYCEKHGIGSRATVYTATNASKYRNDLRTHREIVQAAKSFLKETFGAEVSNDMAVGTA